MEVGLAAFAAVSCRANGLKSKGRSGHRPRRMRIAVPKGVVFLGGRKRRICSAARVDRDFDAAVGKGKLGAKANDADLNPDREVAPDLFVVLDKLERPRNSEERRTRGGSGANSASVLAAALMQPRALKSFVVQPKTKHLYLGRRGWKGDPPIAAAELRFSTVRPDTPSAKHCCDPRTTGKLAEWIETGKKWRILNTNESDQKLISSFSNRPEHRSRVIVIGDVHGCIDELERLLRNVNYAPGDQVIFLGDLVAKGPASLEVVQLAREIKARSCRGNHDHKVISWRSAAEQGVRAAEDIPPEHQKIAESMPEADYKWLVGNPWLITYPAMKMIFVHAGIESGLALSRQRPFMLMNMRSLSGNGRPTTRKGLESWAKSWEGPETVIFGHDASRGLQRHKNAIGLDSACVHGGWLTALILPENQTISVQARRKYKPLNKTPPAG